MSRLTDMKDFRLIPQLVEDMYTEYVKEQEKFICKKLFDLHIDKDILINQIQEIERLNDALREYTDLEEQGLLLKLPCKIGDETYWISDEDEDGNEKLNVRGKSYVVGIGIDKDGFLISTEEGNLTNWDRPNSRWCFLTKEEAEKELERMESEQCKE